MADSDSQEVAVGLIRVHSGAYHKAPGSPLQRSIDFYMTREELEDLLC